MGSEMCIRDSGISDKTSGMAPVNQDTTWSTLTLDIVGITETTIFDIKEHLDLVSNERNVPKSPEERRQKLLSLITKSPALRDKALSELAYATLPCRVGNAPNGAPDYELTAKYFQLLWKAAFDNREPGMEPKPPRQALAPPSSRPCPTCRRASRGSTRRCSRRCAASSSSQTHRGRPTPRTPA